VSGLATVGELDGIYGIPANNLILDSTGKRRPERIAGILTTSRGKQLMAAFTDRAAAAFAFRPGGILALFAA
jgi:hypothetical protein